MKTLVYRGSTTILLFILSWVFTGNLYETSVITILFNVIATAIYYIHERLWLKTNWGIFPKTQNQDEVKIKKLKEA